MLKTVRVPEELTPIFEQAQDYVSRYFARRRADPEHGTIEIFGERYLMVRAGAMSVEFFEMVAQLYHDQGEEAALGVARSLLFDIAHAMGRADAKAFAAKMDVTEPVARLSAGPIHFAHTGWAFVDIHRESRPSADEDFLLVYDHPYSFESDAWIRAKRRPDFPVCIMNAGYSSGWCEESFGVTLVASEILCKAKGDDHCRFVMAHPSAVEARIREYLDRRPEVAPRVKRYEIPGFFARKRAEEALVETQRILKAANEELEARVAERTAALVDAKERLEADVAERKRTEAELIASRALTRRIIEALPGGVVHYGADGKVLEQNPEAERLAEFVSLSYESGAGAVVVTEDGNPANPGDHPASVALRTGKRTGPITLGIRGAEGQVRWAVLSAVPLDDPGDGRVGGAILSFADTTEQRRRDEEQKRLEASLLQAQKLESLGVLAGGVAHDFNNILVAVLGNAGLMRQQVHLDSELLPLIEQIELSARRAADLTAQMLAYSGKGRVRTEAVTLSSTVEEMTQLMRATIPKHIEVKTRLPPDLPPIAGDSSQVRQVIMNLLLNGAEAIGESPGTLSLETGRVELSADDVKGIRWVGASLSPGEHVFLEVCDTGAGMDKATLERIFEPFFTTKFSGRGLGLAATLGILHGHRAAMRIASAPGQGSSFRAVFPIAHAPFPLHEKPLAEPSEKGSGTVLVIDDEAAVRRVAERSLRARGYEVVTAEDGVEGLSVFQSRPDIVAVILDLTMPRMGGLETHRRMREVRPDAIVIVSTGFSRDAGEKRFADEAFDGVLEKPYTPDELASALERALARAQ